MSSSEVELHTARSECDISTKNLETARSQCDTPTKDVQTARSDCVTPTKGVETARSETSTKDVETARESAQSFATIRSPCNTARLNEELDSMVATAQSFLLPVGELQADVQRSVTEIHDTQKQLTHTPQAFDARASSSAKNLGDAPDNHLLASVEGGLNTAIETPTKDVQTARSECDTSTKDVETARSECDTPSKDVQTARSECDTSTKDLETARSECDTSSKDVQTARSDCVTPDVETARENTETFAIIYSPCNTARLNEELDSTVITVQSFLLPVGKLQADVQRSVTEIHDIQKQLTQTPQAFDARASSSAKNFGDAPNNQLLASVEGGLNTAIETSAKDVETARSECDTPTKDVKTARSECDILTKDVETARSECDTPTKDVQTARSEISTKDVVTARESIESSDCNTARLKEELVSVVVAAHLFLSPVGVLHPDVQRSVTEIHDIQKQLTRTPQTFDDRASSSAKNLGDALDNHSLAAVEDGLITAIETSTKDVETARSDCDTPTKDVHTALCMKEPGTRVMLNEWMDIRVGDPFPTRALVKALNQSLNTIGGQNPDQYVALCYRHGEPIMGRVWNEGGNVAASFGWLNNEYKGNFGCIQVLVELADQSDQVSGFDYTWKPFKEVAVFGEKEWSPVHVDYHKGDISPCVLTLEGGKQILGKVDVRNERATVAFDGKEHVFVGPTVHSFMVLCFKARSGQNFD